MSWLDEARDCLPSIRNKIYLNNASTGPLPQPVSNAVKNLVDYRAEYGDPWEYALDKIMELKERYSRFIGASKDEVAYAPGVTYAFLVILSSLDIDKDSNIVVSQHNFPTSLAMAKAMERRGLVKEVRVARDRGGYTEYSDYEKLVDENTSLVIVDYVGWLSGYIEDLKALSDLVHSKGGLLVSDMFHAVGVMPVNVKRLGVDIAFTGSYKWLMSLYGAAMIYVSSDILGDIEPRYMGWLSIDDSVFQRRQRGEDEFQRPFNALNYRYPSDASRFELGTPALTAFTALDESLKFLIKYDAPGKYGYHTKRIADYLAEALIDNGYQLYSHIERHSPITTFRHKNPQETARKLLEEGIEVSARPGLIRVSPHFYNTKDEIEELIHRLKEIDKQ